MCLERSGLKDGAETLTVAEQEKLEAEVYMKSPAEQLEHLCWIRLLQINKKKVLEPTGL